MATQRFTDYIEDPAITRIRSWDRRSVRDACIYNDLYTCGDNDEYEEMQCMVDRMQPTIKSLYLVAKDIQERSKNQTITNVMFILEREAVLTTFEINGSDEI